MTLPFRPLLKPDERICRTLLTGEQLTFWLESASPKGRQGRKQPSEFFILERKFH
jgi:hypothetical protein